MKWSVNKPRRDDESKRNHRALAVIASLALLAWGTSVRADNPSFGGKIVTIIVGTSTGGTTDFSARLMGRFLAKYLPGNPTIVVQNRPGAHALTALSYFAQQAKPDGLTLAVGSVTELDPQNYRVPQSHYDPSSFAMIGGAALGGGILIVSRNALPRLTDKTARPVTMGSVSGYPHVTMLMAAWGIDYLGWNVKWVQGYPSQTAAIVLALQRGEIDMTGFSITGLSDELLDERKYKVIYRTGSSAADAASSFSLVARTPLFADAMAGKIADPLARAALEYWQRSASVVTWAALPPGTPADIVEGYRAAYREIAADPDFRAQGRNFSQDFAPVTDETMTATVRSLAEVSPQVLAVMPQMLRRQGLLVN
jgi:tripartite-type tricarboxylate transporter receptor subunit TctC